LEGWQGDKVDSKIFQLCDQRESQWDNFKTFKPPNFPTFQLRQESLVSAVMLTGKPVADAVVQDVTVQLQELPYTPKLVFVHAGNDPASAAYVRSKARLAKRAGVLSETRVLPPETTQTELLALVGELGADDTVDGILVQLPLYDGLEPGSVLEAIRPNKDVDGFHPINVGRLWTGETGLFPATPSGLIRLLDYYELPIEGQNVLIVGRSNLVGKPAAALFLRRNATVTLAHSRTRDLASLSVQADILVSAVGRPGMITPQMVKPGAVVLDVGQAPQDGVLRGDVDPAVAEVAGFLTPTPGGTGPMTVAMVVANTVTAAVARRQDG
jgi:methylenetetrahydrofolate dehydrogenase (NADP+)/methenyltetrahydrofolate cyclohydrolase